MSSGQQESPLSAARLYRAATKLYTWLPYHFARNGYAFPARHYYFEVTRRCNLRCQMCQYIEWLKNTPASEQRKGELTTAEWLNVIDQVQRFSLATFTGGEPFLRDDFLELLERASGRSRTHVITNAVMLNEARAKRCAELAPRKMGQTGFNFLGTSIEGPPEVHDEIRAMKGAFDKTANGLKMVAEFRDQAGKKCPMIHVTTVIQAANVDYLAQMPRIAHQLGADVLNFTLEIRTLELDGLGETNPYTYKTSDITFPSIDPEQLAKALKNTRAAAAEIGIELRMPDMPDPEIIRYYNGQMHLKNFRCGGIWTNLFIGAKGGAYPCWLQKVGNVRQKTLKQIWNGPQFRKFRAQIKKGLPNPCVGCCSLFYSGGDGRSVD